MGVLDKELGLSNVETAEPVVDASAKNGSAIDENKNKKEAKSDDKTSKVAQSGSKIILHDVKSGETISSIAEKYYSTTDPKVCKALGKFNKLPAPYYDHIVPGDQLKIPARQKVGL